MTTKSEHLWLNLGCSDDYREGYVNVDLPEYDLGDTWVWDDDSVDYILARDIIEHLPDKIHTINEAWRVMKHGAVMTIEVPTTDGPGAFQDPTHVSYWNRNSFKYFEHGNIYRDRFAKDYGIVAAFKIRNDITEQSQDGPRLTIILEAVK